MTTTHGDVMAAIEAAIRAHVPDFAGPSQTYTSDAEILVIRSRPRPLAVPSAGMVVVDQEDEDDDGKEPDEVLIGLGSPQYEWDYRVPIEVVTQQGWRHRSHYDLVKAVLAALRHDPSFGGLVDHSEPARPSYQSAAVKGAQAVESTLIPLRLCYDTNTLAD